MKYEADRSKGGHYFSISDRENIDFQFPLHFHKSFELVYVEEGEMMVQVGKTEFAVPAGHCALILSGQLHAYRTPEHSRSRICIFSPDFVAELMQYCKNVQTHHPVIPLDGTALFQKLLQNQENVFALKALLYDVAARYVSGEVFASDGLKSESLLYDIAAYIDKHFTEPLSLHTLAEHFGYSYRYMSGIINRHFGLSFAGLLQQHRIELACRLLRESEHRITEIASLCGFDTPRSFNRAFQNIMGMTPKEYRVVQ